MKRFAAHYIWYKQVHKMSYIELDDSGLFRGVYPLEGEIAGTAFYDGILLPVVSSESSLSCERAIAEWKSLTGAVSEGSPVWIYRLSGIPLAAAELGAYNGGGNGHVERF